MLISKERWIQRRQWIRIHQALGLVLGFFFSLLGLSGSLSLIGEPSERLMHPGLILNETSQPKISLDTILAHVRSTHPDASEGWVFEMPLEPNQPLLLLYDVSTDSRINATSQHMVWVDPFTGKIIKEEVWGETLRTWTQNLHTSLHLGELGENLVGGLGLLLPVSLISGLYLWWPGYKTLKTAFLFRRRQGLRAFCQDLHRLIGAFLAAPLVLLALTGTSLAFPTALEKLLGTDGMSHDAPNPRIKSTGDRGIGRNVSIDEAILLARGPFPKAEVREVMTPENPTDTYRVNFRQAGEASRRHPMTSVWVDQYSGQIRGVRDASRLNARERMVGALWPLHTGESLSTTMKVIWFLTGLALPMLFWSGLTHWRIEKGMLQDQPIEKTVWFQATLQMRRHAVSGWGKTKGRIRDSINQVLQRIKAIR